MIAFIIKRPVFTAMLIIGFCLLGIISYNRLPVELIPFAELPMLIVQVGGARDADPHYLEQQAVIPLENSIAGLADIETIESYIDRSRATIFVYYTEDVNYKYAYLKLQERVESASAELPGGFFARVWKVDTEQLANMFMTLQARGEGSLDQIREIVDRKVIPEFEQIDGIANIEVYGGRQRSIEIRLDESALRSHNLTASQISSKISEGSSGRQYLGQVVEGNREFFVNLESDYTSISNLENLIIKEQGPVLLKHLGTIIDGGAEEESISRINGMEAISITLVRDQQTNLLSLSRETRDIIESLNDRLESDGIVLAIQTDAAEPIVENIEIIKLLALVGGILAIVVLWIFLRNVPLVLVVALTIPISVMIALNFFYAFDISINTLTLVGLAVALGMLLDNSIVVMENIYRHAAHGKSAWDSVLTGTKEVWRAVSAATLTTVAIFLPFIFSDNFLVRTIGKHVGVSIISALLVSLAIAFLLIPSFTYRILKNKREKQKSIFTRMSQINRQMQIYTLLLKSCLRFPARTILIGTTVFFLSVIICLALSINIPSEVELDEFTLYATMPAGTTLESSDEQILEMDTRLSEIPEIEERRANIEEEVSTITFQLVEDYKDIDDRDLNAIKSDILEKLEGAYRRIDFSYNQPVSNVRYRRGGGGGMGRAGRAFERLLGIGSSEERVVVKGQDMALLTSIADDILFNIENLSTVRRANLSVSQRQPGIDLLFDKTALSHFNVRTTSIMSELAGFQGEFTSGATLQQGTEEISIILKSSDEEETDKTSDDLRQVVVPSNSGGTVPLTQLARLVYNNGYSSINRTNQEKIVEVIYRFEVEVEDSKQLLDGARAEIDQIVAAVNLPPGVAIEAIHDETDLSDFYFLIFTGVILIYMILASIFESLLTPLVMMFTLPLATIGAFWGLILTNNSIYDANVLTGFLILLGVVVNNGIILMDYYRLLRRREYSASRALLMAGQARVRPILITAITTILAMFPLAMGKAEYVAKIGAPFAITVIGGLVAGTLFTLIFIPTVAFGLENVVKWWRGLKWYLRLAQVIIAIAGIAAIYTYIDSFLWRAIDTCVIIMVVPAMTYFLKTSLRRSSAKLIPGDVPINISIRNVVKLYGNYSRFMQEWQGGRRLRERKRLRGELPESAGIMGLLWQMPLVVFLFYFTYLYLESGFWVTLFSIVFYAYAVYLARPFLNPDDNSKIRMRLLRKIGFIVIFWFGPLINILWLFLEMNGNAMAVFIGILWYLGVLIYHTSRKLYREKININRITGRFKRIRKTFYRFVKLIPIIGKKKTPFLALNQVSMDIGNGMFGLVGPNGAGKTTLMRIVCGILSKSFGKVTINDIDIDEKREELQALIGYLPQEFGTYETMTAYQFLDYQAILKGLLDNDKRHEIVERAINSVHLGDSKNIKIQAFSGGMKQRVGIAQTLLHLPRILVVDEPTAGLDPRERIRFRNLLSELSRDRIVIFSTHIIEDISSSCNKLAVLGEGKVKFLGTPRDMVALTEGYVWQAHVTEAEFEEMRAAARIVHHTREGDRIRIRILAESMPTRDAVQVTPTLEDSYLWLLGDKEN
ncbi:MAG: efflux RND transporter permease subunit [candidate division Zixibacteria bacterium]